LGVAKKKFFNKQKVIINLTEVSDNDKHQPVLRIPSLAKRGFFSLRIMNCCSILAGVNEF
jgi:hypothetical protein